MPRDCRIDGEDFLQCLGSGSVCSFVLSFNDFLLQYVVVRLIEFAVTLVRGSYGTPQVFGASHSRKMPAAPNRDEAESETHDQSCASQVAERKFEQRSAYDHRGAGES